MFVAVSYALGAARKAIILLGATKMLFNCFLPFFILRVLEKPATGWVDSLFVSLALLGRKVFAALFCRAGGGAMGLSSFLRRGGESYFVNWY